MTLLEFDFLTGGVWGLFVLGCGEFFDAEDDGFFCDAV